MCTCRVRQAPRVDGLQLARVVIGHQHGPAGFHGDLTRHLAARQEAEQRVAAALHRLLGADQREGVSPGHVVELESATMICVPPLMKLSPIGVCPTLTLAMRESAGFVSSLAAENATSALLSRSVTHTDAAIGGHDHPGRLASGHGRRLRPRARMRSRPGSCSSDVQPSPRPAGVCALSCVRGGRGRLGDGAIPTGSCPSGTRPTSPIGRSRRERVHAGRTRPSRRCPGG